jgi:hypothetical protein
VARAGEPVEVAAALVILERARVTVLDTERGGRVAQGILTGERPRPRQRRAARRSSARRARRILRGVALHADLLAEGLALGGAVAVSD